jgi:hypothetical protein
MFRGGGRLITIDIVPGSFALAGTGVSVHVCMDGGSGANLFRILLEAGKRL